MEEGNSKLLILNASSLTSSSKSANWDTMQVGRYKTYKHTKKLEYNKRVSSMANYPI